MRSPGVIYREYRRIKKKYLYNKISDSYRKSHDNCVYGELIRYKAVDGRNRSIKLCTYSASAVDDIGKLDVCTCPETCSAFASNKSREDIIKEYEEELNDPAIKASKYPDLNVLEWALAGDIEKARKNPTVINKILIYIIDLLERLIES